MTPSEIDPASFQFVAQRLNHCVTACPCSVFFIIYLLAIRKYLQIHYFLLANVLVFLPYLGGVQRPHPS
jgi:hypothetical protein